MKNDEQLAIDVYSKQLGVSLNLLKNTTNIEIEKIIENISQIDLQGKKILDLGCGTGQLTKIILESSPDDYSLSGIDVSGEDIVILNKTVSDKRLTTQEGTFYKIPYQDNHFDIVVSNHVIQYAEDVESVFKEVERVLKENGIFIFSTVCFDVETKVGEIVYGKLALSDGTSLNVHAYARSFSQISNTLARESFVPVYDLSYRTAELFIPHNYIPDTEYAYNTLVSTWQKCSTKQESPASFSRTLDKARRYLSKHDISCTFVDTEIIDGDKGTQSKGYFLGKNIYIKNQLSDELKLYVLLHCYGHIAQWHFNDKYYIPLSDKLNTVDIVDIDKKIHHEHELDTMHYCLFFLAEIGEYNLAEWLVQYFNADMLYMDKYFETLSLPTDEEFTKFFISKPISDDKSMLYLKSSSLDKKINFSTTPVYVL